ncbi:MAG: AraC family transcriptional regulator [Clostridia bacterium]|nr:AraC family transcriptional regulator [Clostridia bacterium]
MINHFYSVEGNLKDLNPRNYGYEQCSSGQTTGPKARNYTLVHYVESGKGTLEKNGKIYEVHPGEAFIILAGETATYKADDKDPWFYRYICFDGELSNDFARLPAVFKGDAEFFRKISKVEHISGRKVSMLTSLLFSWHAEICQDDDMPTNNYVQQIKDYINSNYMNDISVEKIAKQINLTRSYLVRLFKKSTGQTIQEYIVSVRLKAAKLCLENKMSVTEAAYSCGFGDLSNFSKMFKKYLGLSPMKYKKSLSLKLDHPGEGEKED